MNLFKGLTNQQILSFFLAFGLFNLFVIMEAAALAAFYMASKPRGGRVRTAAAWHVGAAVWFNFAVVSAVWSAPAEKAFVNGSKLFDMGYERFQKVLIGLAFTAIGVLFMAVGFIQGSRQKRAQREEALAA
ncbi:MAG: hypothetical protein ABR564_05305 [Candidatus Dormibacteria bacterium]